MTRMSRTRGHRAVTTYHTADVTPTGTVMKQGPGIVVRRVSFAASTRYRIEGLPELVQMEVDAIKRNYPPMGYGTWADLPRFVSDGVVEVTVDRSNSCD